MSSALDIITDALVRMGVYGPGETITDADAERCLSILNDMLDSWSNESLTVFANLTQNFNTVAGVSAYTIGPGATWNGVRPLSISTDPGTVFLTDANLNVYQVDVVTQQQYNLATTGNVNSQTPDTLFYDPQFPFGVVNLFPTPAEVIAVTIVCTLALAGFANLYAALSLPPGYKDALQKCLLVEAWSTFKPDGTNPSQTQLALAMKAKGNVKRKNYRPRVSQVDPYIASRGGSTYNIYTGSSR
jgi:GH24 family phage-related lysozyme (muramidase)